MKTRLLAKRYGKALFDLAVELGELDRITQDMRFLSRTSQGVPSLLRGLGDERIGIDRRLAAALKVTSVLGIGKTVSNFIGLLISRGRISIFELICSDFDARVERYNGLLSCHANVAHSELADKVRGQIEKIVGDALNAKVRCSIDLDPSLIGGFAVWIGDLRFDASIRGRLERMREELAGT